jgi:hypothetical protein
MDSNQPRKTSTAFEYFLYAAILAETGLAAVIYKVIFRDPGMGHFSFYFAIFYFAFLGWAIAQLNILHRDRNPRVADSTPVPPEPVQEVIATQDSRPVFGLTTLQLLIVVLVFATAVATFSCALRLLN